MLYLQNFVYFLFFLIMKCMATLHDPEINIDVSDKDNYFGGRKTVAMHQKQQLSKSRGNFMESSPLSTFIIAILLIVYACFRSMSLEDDEDASLQSDDKSDMESSSKGLFQTIDFKQALFLPIGTSLILLALFYFDFMQMVVTTGAAVMALSAFSYLTFPLCQYITRKLEYTEKYSLSFCGRCSSAELLSFVVSTIFVIAWLCTDHWLLANALSAGICVSIIAVLRLPSLKVSCLLLVGLLFYDVFWVFFSSHLFKHNVMLKVATTKSENPMKFIARKLKWKNARKVPKLSLPGKLIFPTGKVSQLGSPHFTFLGLGDIIIPGLLLCFVLRYDNYKRKMLEESENPQNFIHKIRYFYCILFGYFVGLVCSLTALNSKKNVQPALLYLVPCTILPLIVLAYFKGDLKDMWNSPFRMMSRRIDV